MFFKIKRCRSCNSTTFVNRINIKPMPLGDKYSKKKNQYNKHVDLNVIECKNCNHLQTNTTVNPKILYSNYLSRPAAVNAKLSKDFSLYAQDLIRYINKKDSILEIGSNDGSFLKYFKNKGYKNITGIEPAKNLAKISNNQKINTINDYFSKKLIEKLYLEGKKFKLIINNHSLSNIHDINEVFDGVKFSLEKKGVYSIQTFYAADVIKKKLLENFNHEHIHYFFITTLNKLVNRHGLEIFKAFHVKAKGGSIRAYISHIGDFKIDKSVKKFFMDEKKYIKNKKFLSSVEKFIKKNSKLINKIIKRNKYKKIYAYGTSIGATVFITQYNLKNSIKYLIDDDSYRQNLYSPGYNIYVKSNDIIKNKPDLIIILAPLYAKQIINRVKEKFGNKDFLKIWPEVELIK